VGFTDGGVADELDDARETAAHLGLDHHEIRIGFHDFFDSLRRCVLVVEEPLATTSIIPMDHLAKLAAQHVKVVMSGQGADESLGGYDRYQSELIRGIVPPIVARPINAFAHAVGMKDDRLLRSLRTLSQADDISRFVETYTVFDPAEIKRLTGQMEVQARDSVAYFYDLLGCRVRSTSVQRMMDIDLRMNLADDLLLYTDKITMRHSLECRVPMLDIELVSFIESLPVEHKIKLFHGKLVHKRFAREILPASIVQRKKKGFRSPTQTWFKRRDMLDGILLNQSSKFARFFDLQEVRRIISRHIEGHNMERQLFLLLGLYFWMEEFT
jgi:asparagine synthase (glutamine-hydrolysing)